MTMNLNGFATMHPAVGTPTSQVLDEVPLLWQIHADVQMTHTNAYAQVKTFRCPHTCTTVVKTQQRTTSKPIRPTMLNALVKTRMLNACQKSCELTSLVYNTPSAVIIAMVPSLILHHQQTRQFSLHHRATERNQTM
ncbi:uncharacterized protein LOC143183438 isoform X2 [Calliopsis andreniformis]|uniref:uncharacterized protein LOC143183438 isoform X2 n=1 Tax=Calliopsis andreniformis TaxID=337506 RepID=UPI003FCDB229